MAKIKQVDGSVIIPDGWMPASHLSAIQLALISTFLAISPWIKVCAWVRERTSFPLTQSPLDPKAHRYCSKVSWPASLKILFGNYDGWRFSECYKNKSVLTHDLVLQKPVCCLKRNKQGSKQETEKGSMVGVMRPGSKSTRNKHIFKPSHIHRKFFILTWIHLSSLISYLQLSSWQQVFRVNIQSNL